MSLDRWTDINGLLEELPPNFNKKYIYALVLHERIPYVKPSPNKLLFNLDHVEKWLQDCSVNVEEPAND